MVDLSRLIVVFCPEAFSDSALRTRFLNGLLAAADWQAEWTVPLSKTRETNILLVLRTLANSFQDECVLTDAEWADQV